MESSVHVGRETTSLESELRIALGNDWEHAVFTQQDDPSVAEGLEARQAACISEEWYG